MINLKVSKTGGIVFILSVVLQVGLFAASDLDSVSFATYYPSPYGSYNEMRVNKLSVGSTYHDYTISVGDNNLIVEGNVGIGIANPAEKLDVVGKIHATGDICSDQAGGKCLSTAGCASCDGSPCGTVQAAFGGSYGCLFASCNLVVPNQVCVDGVWVTIAKVEYNKSSCCPDPPG